ncbi:MAG: glycosyltransferase family 4 protein [Janthinobacterium lividum]
MKVLVLHNRYRPTAPSGENVVVDQESAALAARGHEVVVEQRHSEEVASWSVLRRATLPARVLWSESSRRSLAASLAEHRPDVVHVHNLFPLLTPSVLRACLQARVPVVASIHNYKLGCANGELFRDGRVCHDCLGRPTSLPAVTHGCYRGSALATAPVALGMLLHAPAWRTMVSAYAFLSAAQRDLLAPVGLPAGRSFVKGNFVPPAVTPAGSPTGHQVAFVARLDEAKGARLVMRAWDLFRARRPGSTLKLVVAGGGALADELLGWAQGRASVRMVGRLPRTEVSALMSSSRAVLVPSQWEETFGMVAIEAMAAGTAPVATDHGAFGELITTGVDGALFAAGDVEALVRILGDVDDRPARWDAFGRRGRETYAARFSPEVGITRLEEIYAFAVAHPVHADGRDLGGPAPARSTALDREVA